MKAGKVPTHLPPKAPTGHAQTNAHLPVDQPVEREEGHPLLGDIRDQCLGLGPGSRPDIGCRTTSGIQYVPWNSRSKLQIPLVVFHWFG